MLALGVLYELFSSFTVTSPVNSSIASTVNISVYSFTSYPIGATFSVISIFVPTATVNPSNSTLSPTSISLLTNLVPSNLVTVTSYLEPGSTVPSLFTFFKSNEKLPTSS